MSRSYRFALRPGWVTLHVVTVVLIVAMALLGRWQLDVSNSKHFSLQNFGYAIQWWLFATFTLALWGRLMRDAARGESSLLGGGATPRARPAEAGGEVDTGGGVGVQTVAPGGYRRYVMPAAEPAAADAVHTDYNDYLARLATADANGGASPASRADSGWDGWR